MMRLMRAAKAIAFVIHTRRFDDSLAFYGGTLELDVLEEWHDGGHGAVLALSPNSELELIELDEPGPHGGVALGLEVDDADAWYERVKRRGVPVKAPPRDAFGKRGFGITDPN